MSSKLCDYPGQPHHGSFTAKSSASLSRVIARFGDAQVLASNPAHCFEEGAVMRRPWPSPHPSRFQKTLKGVNKRQKGMSMASLPPQLEHMRYKELTLFRDGARNKGLLTEQQHRQLFVDVAAPSAYFASRRCIISTPASSFYTYEHSLFAMAGGVSGHDSAMSGRSKSFLESGAHPH